VLPDQYWRSAEGRDRYPRPGDHPHLPAGRDSTRGVGDKGDFGIFHETSVLDRHETVSVGMPAEFGLGGATSLVPLADRGQRAAHRLDRSVLDVPAVAPC